MNFLNRVGGFFILVGLICLAVFFFTEPEEGISNLRWLIIGFSLTFVGFWMKARNRPEEVESTRFRSMRKVAQKSREEREKRLAKRKAKENQKRSER